MAKDKKKFNMAAAEKFDPLFLESAMSANASMNIKWRLKKITNGL